MPPEPSKVRDPDPLLSNADAEQSSLEREVVAEELASLQDPTDLRSSVVSGLAWNTLLSISVQASRMLSSLVLVHLLAPSDYGLAGMALVFSAFIATFQDVGFGAALVQRRVITEIDRSTVFWTTVAIGAVSTLVVIGLAGLIADFFHEPRVKNLVVVLSFTLVIGSLGTTQGSLLHRAMKFRAIAIRLMIATFGACAAAIAVAAAGGGAWALIAYQLVITSLVTLLLWQLAAWRPRFVFSTRSLKGFAGFGSNVVGFRFLDFLQTNTDNILVGRYLGSAALGLYSVSYNVILIPLGRLFSPVGNTLFAAASRMQDDAARVARVWIRSVRGALAVILPTVLGLFVVAPDFVEVILGPQWHGATPVIRILGFVTVTYGLSVLANSILMALDRSHLVFRLTLLNTLLAIGAFAVGLRWGVVGVAACYAVVTIPINVARLLYVNSLLDVSLGSFARAISGVLQATLLMVAVCWLTRESLLRTDMAVSLRLAVVVLVGIGTYLLATVWRNRGVIQEIRSLRPRSGRPAGAAT